MFNDDLGMFADDDLNSILQEIGGKTGEVLQELNVTVNTFLDG